MGQMPVVGRFAPCGGLSPVGRKCPMVVMKCKVWEWNADLRGFSGFVRGKSA
ncbi:MAG: hypothetical protein FWG87_04530 [Defluviitaleaceae bacterium]|nr:hypothetical protein [Defluviitaleaceae bacterium]